MSQHATGAAVRSDAWAATPARSSRTATVSRRAARPRGGPRRRRSTRRAVRSSAGIDVRPYAGPMADDPSRVRVSPTLVIPASELSWRFSRSGGPGGQHANTADTRPRCASTSPVHRRSGRASEPGSRNGSGTRCGSWPPTSAPRRATGELALERLCERLAAALRVDRPRRPTKPTAGQRPAAPRGQAPPGRPQGGPAPPSRGVTNRPCSAAETRNKVRSTPGERNRLTRRRSPPVAPGRGEAGGGEERTKRMGAGSGGHRGRGPATRQWIAAALVLAAIPAGVAAGLLVSSSPDIAAWVLAGSALAAARRAARRIARRGLGGAAVAAPRARRRAVGRRPRRHRRRATTTSARCRSRAPPTHPARRPAHHRRRGRAHGGRPHAPRRQHRAHRRSDRRHRCRRRARRVPLARAARR